jgi:hypothetical protein
VAVICFPGLEGCRDFETNEQCQVPERQRKAAEKAAEKNARNKAKKKELGDKKVMQVIFPSLSLIVLSTLPFSFYPSFSFSLSSLSFHFLWLIVFFTPLLVSFSLLSFFTLYLSLLPFSLTDLFFLFPFVTFSHPIVLSLLFLSFLFL